MKSLKRKLATALSAAVVGLSCGDKASAGPIGWVVGLATSPTLIALAGAGVLAYKTNKELKLGNLHLFPVDSDGDILASDGLEDLSLKSDIKGKIVAGARNVFTVVGRVWRETQRQLHMESGNYNIANNPTIGEVLESIWDKSISNYEDVSMWMPAGRKALIEEVNKMVDSSSLSFLRKRTVKAYWEAILGVTSDKTLDDILCNQFANQNADENNELY